MGPIWAPAKGQDEQTTFDVVRMDLFAESQGPRARAFGGNCPALFIFPFFAHLLRASQWSEFAW